MVTTCYVESLVSVTYQYPSRLHIYQLFLVYRDGYRATKYFALAIASRRCQDVSSGFARVLRLSLPFEWQFSHLGRVSRFSRSCLSNMSEFNDFFLESGFVVSYYAITNFFQYWMLPCQNGKKFFAEYFVSCICQLLIYCRFQWTCWSGCIRRWGVICTECRICCWIVRDFYSRFG